MKVDLLITAELPSVTEQYCLETYSDGMFATKNKNGEIVFKEKQSKRNCRYLDYSHKCLIFNKYLNNPPPTESVIDLNLLRCAECVASAKNEQNGVNKPID